MKIQKLNVVLICYTFSGTIHYLTVQDVLTKKLIFKNFTDAKDSTPSQNSYNQFLELLTFIHTLFNDKENKNYSTKNKNALLCIDLPTKNVMIILFKLLDQQSMF